MTNEEVKKIKWNIDVSIPEPAPKRGGRSTTVLVVRDVVERYLSADTVKAVRLFVADFGARDDMGFDKHKQNLETDDGRDSEKDGYEELLDASQYYKKLSIEKPTSRNKAMYDAVLDLTFMARNNLIVRQEEFDAMDFESSEGAAHTERKDDE